jgi:hypothetical protein
MFAYAMVYAFVVSAQDDEVPVERQLVGHGLVELFAVGGGEDYLIVVALCLQGRYASVYRFALDYHARKSPEGVIVYASELVGGVVAQVVQVYLCQSFFLRPCQDGFVYESFQHLR